MAKKPKRNDATFCRSRGWTVGTIIDVRFDEMDVFEILGRFSERPIGDVYRITAIGDMAILVRRQNWRGKGEGPEQCWTQTLINRIAAKAEAK